MTAWYICSPWSDKLFPLLGGVVPDVQEEDHEWGGPGTECYVSGLAEPLAKLARAARRWRLELSESREVSYYFANCIIDDLKRKKFIEAEWSLHTLYLILKKKHPLLFYFMSHRKAVRFAP